MLDRAEDRLAIAELMYGWIYRDVGDWDRLSQLFHPDGVIEVTWFEGLFRDFVAASRRMGTTGAQTKHEIGQPNIRFNGMCAIAETNAVILCDSARVDFGCACHNRFYDMVEKRNGEWRIVKRQSIYDMGTFLFPFGPVEIDQKTVRSYPRAYAPLGYFLQQCGIPVRRVFATKGDNLEKTIRKEGEEWLMGGRDQ